ncbi:MAG: sialidase family protein [Planctomycetota bacterium]|nr:sialidase family protein [Planctomycetota bacterium]
MKILRRYPNHPSARLNRCLMSVSSLMLLQAAVHAQDVMQGGDLLQAEAVYQGEEASDAFSAIHYLGNGRIIAGKRSSQAANRFLLSEDYGATWEVVGCPNSTGAHTYFFGQNGATVFSGTGDTGSACLMKSTDGGSTWTVALSASQINNIIGSANARAVFSPVYLGEDRWAVNIKSFDTANKVIMSSDNGVTWYVPGAQPGQDASAWARRMILTGDNILLWPSCTTDQMYRSADQGGSWTSVSVPGAFLFQSLCDAGNGVYLCGDATTTPYTPISLYRSLDAGLSWAEVTAVNLQRPTPTYWRDVIKVESSLLASACCFEGTSDERHMQLFLSVDDGTTWLSLGNPYHGPYGGMQAIYQMCATESDVVFAGCQPDSTILKWSMPVNTCPADLDDDGTVNTGDLLILLGGWGTPDGDVDGDGDTDTVDLLALLGAWGECPQPSTA